MEADLVVVLEELVGLLDGLPRAALLRLLLVARVSVALGLVAALLLSRGDE